MKHAKKYWPVATGLAECMKNGSWIELMENRWVGHLLTLRVVAKLHTIVNLT